MKHFEQSEWTFPGVGAFVRLLRRMERRRYRADITATSMNGGGQKLMPIAEVLARTGREPRAPD